LLVAVLLLAAFVIVEARSAVPLLPLRFLRIRGLAVADTVALAVLAAPFGVSFVATLYLQDVLHHSPMRTALTLLPGSALCAVVGRYVAPRALDRFGLRTVYTAGLVLVAGGNAVLLTITSRWAIVLIVIASVISFGLGMGLAYPAATVGGVAGTDSGDHGTAAGLNNTALQIGGGAGLAAVAAAVTTGLNGHMVTAVAADTALHAVRLGALTVTLIPLAGAVIALVGLRRH
jgi:Na+/melibiose symporter-like transporter